MIGRCILSLAAFALGAISLGVDAQVSTDIGPVGIPGSFTGGGSDYTVSGSGNDIWGHWDQFTFLHFNHTGNVTVTCLVKEFTDATHAWRKAGIMFRNNLGERSAHSMLMLTGWGIAQQSRQNQNTHSISYHDTYSIKNVWFRLVKEGNMVTSFVKRDGEHGFMQYNSVEVDLGESFYVGLAVTSHDNSKIGTLDVSNFEISDDVFSLSAEPREIGETGKPVWVQEYRPGMWSISAGGSDIGGTSDSFGFFDQEQSGDIVATLYLEKLTRRNNDSKGGLMIRASHSVDAPHVSLLVTAKDGITMFARSATGGTTTSENVGVWAEDMELRLEKTGNSVKCMYKHASATEWFVIGTKTADLDTGGIYHVGQALSSADHGQHARLTTGSLVVEAA